VRPVIACASAAALLLWLAGPSFANGAPVKIPLSRLPGVVNYGSAPASGAAEVTAVEGDVTVQVQGLNRLTSELYQAWLVNTRTGDRVSVGKFNSTADGTAKIASVVQLGNREFDLFVITVEPEPDPSPNEDARIVLAGYWPGREPTPRPAATASAGGTPPPTAVAGTPSVPATGTVVSTAPPSGLPRTGGPGFGALATLLVALGAGAFVAGRGLRR
jgi:hypothetical protein